MGKKYYLSINSSNNLVHSTTSVVDLVGEEKFFKDRGAIAYWLVDSTDKQSILNALSKAFEKDVNIPSTHWFITNFTCTVDDIQKFLGGAGLKIEKHGESSWQVTDGHNEIVGATPLIAFLSWYSPEFEKKFADEF